MICRGDAVSQGLPRNWHSRIRGFLFLPHSFDHVSNNKLSICNVGDGFEQWLYKQTLSFGAPRTRTKDLTKVKQQKEFKEYVTQPDFEIGWIHFLIYVLQLAP
jgi:hypothetical protein